MFFNSISDLPTIINRSQTIILNLDPNTELPITPVLTIAPNEKNQILIDQIRELISAAGTKQQQDQYFVIKHADKITPEAANAFLKLIEEPKDHYHFILVTQNPSRLLPTILSRAQLFILRQEKSVDELENSDKKVQSLARKLLMAKPQELCKISATIGKDSKTAREKAIAVTETAIDMAYKSYFKTNNRGFLEKLSKLLTLYENLTKNGNVKLHIVADLC